MDNLLEAVRSFVAEQPGESPFLTAIEGLAILRSNHGKKPSHLIFKPSLCLVVQGRKRTMFGSKRFEYRAGQALVVNVELPAVSQVIDASPREPYLAVALEFDLTLMREVLESLGTPLGAESEAYGSVFVSDVPGPLTDTVLRMMRLLGTPQAISALSPLLTRELYYWLLSGPHGGQIASIALSGSHTQRVIGAIHRLREHFAEAVRGEDLAAAAQLSSSAFHRQFKALTDMTPLQYQKQLRLLEARRLMIAGEMNAETASYAVGYESPSQFSREYSRMFGNAPRRDVAAFRAVLAT